MAQHSTAQHKQYVGHHSRHGLRQDNMYYLLSEATFSPEDQRRSRREATACLATAGAQSHRPQGFCPVEPASQSYASTNTLLWVTALNVSPKSPKRKDRSNGEQE